MEIVIEKILRDDLKDSYHSSRNKGTGEERRKAIIQANKTKGRKANEDAFGLFEDYDDYEDYDGYDGYDDAEEASANYYRKKAMQYDKKSAKNHYITSQKYREISENPNVDENDRHRAAIRANDNMDYANHCARSANNTNKEIKNGLYDSEYSNDTFSRMRRDHAKSSYRINREDSERSGERRREATIQAARTKGRKAKESAFDFSETGLFTTLFTPAYEAAEDYDDDDLLMDEELDEEIKGEPNDMIIDDDEEYSDSEYDKDEELDEE